MVNPGRVSPINSGGDQVSDSSKARPTAPPDTQKNFKKLVSNDDEGKKGNQEASTELEEGAELLSPFELASAKKQKAHVHNPFAAAPEKKLSPLKSQTQSDEVASEDEALALEEKADAENKAGFGHYLEAKSDLAGLPPPLPSIYDTGLVSAAKELPPAVSMKSLLDQMIKEIQVMQHEGKTNTLVTLQYPPIFDNAQLKITTSELNKGQFDVVFSNLKPEAKQLIDMRLNEGSLALAMERKGVILNSVLTSTLPEKPLNVDTEQSTYLGRDQQQQQQQGQNQEEEES